MKARTYLVNAAVIALLFTASTEALAQAPFAHSPQTSAPVPHLALTVQEPELVELLDANLGSLADWSRRSRHVGGYVMIGLGAATAVGGAVTLAAWDHEDADIVGYSLIGGGVLLAGLSILPFKIRGEVERIYDEFAEMPAGTPSEVRAKFAYGDRRFEELARRRRTERYISGAVFLGIGVTELVIDDDSRRWIGFGTPLVVGATTLLLKSEEERRYESYQRAKEDIRGPAGTAPTVGLGMTFLPRRGPAAVVQVRF